MRVRQAVYRVLSGSLRKEVPLLGAAAFAIACLPAVAVAQQSPSVKPAILEDIVVTATKRRERLLDVPLSVSALSGDELAQRELLSLTDIAGQVPGLAIQRATATRNRLIIRGLNAGGSGATVATVLDEVPLSRSSAVSDAAATPSDFYTYDMERIEVLRGPQGTLYGANAVGGLVKYVTRAPDPSAFAAAVEIGASSVTDGGTGVSVRGLVNAPLGDNTALRLVGYGERVPGWVDNWLLGSKDQDEGRRTGGRASLLWNASDALSVRGTVIYNQRKADWQSYVNVAGQPDGSAVVPANRFDLVRGRAASAYLPGDEESKQTNAYVNVDWRLGGATFTSISAYTKIDTNVNADLSGTLAAPRFFLLPLLEPAFGQPLRATRNDVYETKKWSQEFRLASETDQPAGAGTFEWQLGLFGTKEDTDGFVPINFRSAAGQILTTPLAGGDSFSPSQYKEGALYANVSYYLTPRFDVSVGARYSKIKQQVSTRFTAGLATGGAFDSGVNDVSQSATTWSIAPRFKISDDTIAYARVATGFRPGGPQQLVPGLPTNAPPYKRDESVNYEIGFRTSLLERRVTVDVAAFYVDWKDVQVLSRVDINGTIFTIPGNAGEAKTKGLEWDLGWAPLDGLRFGLVGSYVEAELASDAPLLGRVSGDRLPFVPKLTNTVNARYEWDVGTGRAHVGAAWTHFGSVFTDFGFATAGPPPLSATYVELPSYEVATLQIGYERGPFSVSLYAQNLGDEEALLSYTSAGTTPGDFLGQATILPPRTIGLRLGYSF